MSKQVTIQAPVANGGTMDITGRVAFFNVGESREKFLIQDTETSEKFLTHYKSGMKIKSTTPTKIRYMRSGKRLTERSAAELTLIHLIESVGVEKFQSVLNSAKVINP